MTAPPNRFSKTAYLAELRQELEESSGLGLASRELAVAEVTQHIDLLRESLGSKGSCEEELEHMAVSRMENPVELARAFGRADLTARHACPLQWHSGNIRAWVQFLELKSTCVMAGIASAIVVLTALVLGAIIPITWQELLIVPTVATATFCLTVAASRLLPHGKKPLETARFLFSAVAFALGAHLATYSAEVIEGLQWPFARPAAYSALLGILSLFTAVSFSGIFFNDPRSRQRFFATSFIAVLGTCLPLTFLLGLLPGSHHGVLLFVYTMSGTASVLAVRQYVRLDGGRVNHFVRKTR